VPGEGYLAAIDALHDSPIDVMILPRRRWCGDLWRKAYEAHRPARNLLRHQRPGATHMPATGVHIAMQDSTPMILLVGQVDTGMREREAFQELDLQGGVSAPWRNGAVEIDRPTAFRSWSRAPSASQCRAVRVGVSRAGDHVDRKPAIVADAMRIEQAVMLARAG